PTRQSTTLPAPRVRLPRRCRGRFQPFPIRAGGSRGIPLATPRLRFTLTSATAHGNTELDRNHSDLVFVSHLVFVSQPAVERQRSPANSGTRVDVSRKHVSQV